MKHYIIIGFLFILLGCEESGNGVVSFGSNFGLLTCPVEAKVFIDGTEIGTIPGYCDSVVNCVSDYTLNKLIPVGEHSYKIEIQNQSGNCYMEKSGEIIIERDECVRVFFDVIQNE